MISDCHPLAIQVLRGATRDVGDFVSVVEMRMQTDFLVLPAPPVNKVDQRVRPLGVRKDLHRHHRRSFRRKSNALDVRDGKQRLADGPDPRCRQEIRIAT